jgi:DNA-binding GntR family transcriptional regulator
MDERKQSVADKAPKAGKEAEERVYNAIMETILEHGLTPGTKLTETGLANVLGASRSAVRAALSRLGHDRIVDLRPNRGAVVAEPSLEEAKELFDARRAVEVAIIRAVSRRLTPETARKLRTFTTEEKEAYLRGDLRKAQHLSRSFHIVLAEASGNSYLLRFLKLLIFRQPLLQLAHSGNRLHYCGVHEHEALLEPLLNGDIETAERKTLEHLNSLEAEFQRSAKEAHASLSEILVRSVEGR